MLRMTQRVKSHFISYKKRPNLATISKLTICKMTLYSTNKITILESFIYLFIVLCFVFNLRLLTSSSIVVFFLQRKNEQFSHLPSETPLGCTSRKAKLRKMVTAPTNAYSPEYGLHKSKEITKMHKGAFLIN